MSLTEEIKAHINYTETTPVKCKNCKHSKQTENPHVDRMWDRNCHVAVVTSFRVSDDGRCDRFESV